MAMTLRLSTEEDRALTLLASAWGCSKQEAVKRAVAIAAARMIDDATITQLARDTIPHYAGMEARIRRARPGEG
nr:Uncharacterised protein [Streptococcus thermophilus]